MLNIFGNLLHGLAGWRQRQRAYAELATLDDRSLADIGITRSEIPYVLSHAAEHRAEMDAQRLARGLIVSSRRGEPARPRPGARCAIVGRAPGAG
jgi:uncharacterized protein YjiS (DUF1127 family)